MPNLKALETLAVEHGKVSPCQIFEVASKEDAAILIAQGRAEATTAKVTTDLTAPEEHEAPVFVEGIKVEAKETTKKIGHK